MLGSKKVKKSRVSSREGSKKGLKRGKREKSCRVVRSRVSRGLVESKKGSRVVSKEKVWCLGSKVVKVKLVVSRE